MPACHAGGRRFEPVPGRQFNMRKWLRGRASPCQGEGREFESRLPLHFAQIAQLVEQGTENPRVLGSIPSLGTTLSCFYKQLFLLSSILRIDFDTVPQEIRKPFRCLLYTETKTESENGETEAAVRSEKRQE